MPPQRADRRGIAQSGFDIVSYCVETFDFAEQCEFWPSAFGVEVVSEQGDRSLRATFNDGHIRLGIADWSAPDPTARFLSTSEELAVWLSRP